MTIGAMTIATGENADTRIAAVRRFNRYYTRQIGVLRKTFLDSPYSLGEARILYEIASRPSPTASDIARSLDLDPGYLSRALRSFERRGLIRNRPSQDDGRQSHLTLTPRGKKSFMPLEARSQSDTAAMLGRLAPADQARLIAAMATIETLLAEQSQEPAPQQHSILRPPRPGDFGWIVKRHAELYAQEYRWREPFEGVCAQIVADFVNKYDASRERCWIAEIDGEPVGTVMLVKGSETVAKLRLLIVEPSARGFGIGRALTNECLRFAREAGYVRMTLWTQSILVAARSIYRAAGFELVKEEPHHSFGHDLIGETWERDL